MYLLSYDKAMYVGVMRSTKVASCDFVRYNDWLDTYSEVFLIIPINLDCFEQFCCQQRFQERLVSQNHWLMSSSTEKLLVKVRLLKLD